jgi:hypothetical protein
MDGRSTRVVNGLSSWKMCVGGADLFALRDNAS